jgi:hypothetical protein
LWGELLSTSKEVALLNWSIETARRERRSEPGTGPERAERPRKSMDL